MPGYRPEYWKPHKTHARVISKGKGGEPDTLACIECGHPFPKHPTHPKDCCSKPCNAARQNRRIKRGLAIIDDALRWRGNRKDARAVGDLCAKLSIFLEEDRAAGRPSW
jgi:hypothetical protein